MAERAVLYARVSGDDTRKDGRNLESQLAMCREHAQRKGYDIVAELQEDAHGASGADLDLPQLSAALEMARAGRYDVLVVRELDRFARSLAKQLIVEEELRRANVEIDYVLGEYPDTPEGSLNKNIKAVIAEYERLKIIERMVRGRRNKAKAGQVVLHGHTPYGYRAEKVQDAMSGNLIPTGRLLIHEPEARVVRMIYHCYTMEQMSARAIAMELSQTGIPTPGNADHGKWHPKTVAYMLENETYAGLWHYGKGIHDDNPQETWIPVEVTPIVDRATWERVQELRKQVRKRIPRPAKHEYLLRRRALCGKCGAAMTCSSRFEGRYRHYRCPPGTGQDKAVTIRAPDEGKYFRADRVDALAWEKIKEWLTEPVKLRDELERIQENRDRDNAPLRARLQVNEDLLAKHRAKLEKLLDSYLDGVFDKEMLVRRRQELGDLIADLERERETLIATLETQSLSDGEIQTVLGLAAELGAGLERGEADFARRRKIMRMLDVEARLWTEDGHEMARQPCHLLRKDEDLSVSGDNTRSL